eukprot:360722-Chlamydomonas_euryale.AAC.3
MESTRLAPSMLSNAVTCLEADNHEATPPSCELGKAVNLGKAVSSGKAVSLGKDVSSAKAVSWGTPVSSSKAVGSAKARQKRVGGAGPRTVCIQT